MRNTLDLLRRLASSLRCLALCCACALLGAEQARDPLSQTVLFEEVIFEKLPEVIQKTLVREAPDVVTVTKITDRTGTIYFRVPVMNGDGDLSETITLDAAGSVLNRAKAPAVARKPRAVPPSAPPTPAADPPAPKGASSF